MHLNFTGILKLNLGGVLILWISNLCWRSTLGDLANMDKGDLANMDNRSGAVGASCLICMIKECMIHESSHATVREGVVKESSIEILADVLKDY
ncbi:hypothetical protein L1987_29995 [Smallanthus sonchifolius]|uniref:Uncharacterized protein n=1 Tax=Smallanthus sonchifolius TaxID=185202 RepID=A0ACB9I0Z6_9ASTR|nr:hypothetical protein L1987_29995 [Smallanthus sonchifolius]